MPVSAEELHQLAQEFADCRRGLAALGDTNRQHLLLEMMQMAPCSGVRVGEITQRTHLSRPAVSHHLKILKEAGIIQMRREGTRNYYFIAADQKEMARLRRMLDHVARVMQTLHPGETILQQKGEQ